MRGVVLMDCSVCGFCGWFYLLWFRLLRLLWLLISCLLWFGFDLDVCVVICVGWVWVDTICFVLACLCCFYCG